MFKAGSKRQAWSGLAVWQVAGFLAGLTLAHGGPSDAYTIRHWTTDNGLPQNRVTALAQTPDGYLWLGSWFGLARFDGVHFTVFNHYNTPVLANDAVNALAVAPDGALWIGTRGGLFRLRERVWTRFTPANGLPDACVWDLAFDTSGALWLEAGEQAGRFPGGPFISTLRWRRQVQVPVRKLVPLAGGGMGLSIPPGPVHLANLAQSVLDSLPKLGEKDYCLNVTWDGRGGWWLGTREGLFHRDAGKFWSQVWTSPSPACYVGQMFRDTRGDLWGDLETAGLHRFNGVTWERFPLGSGGYPEGVTSFLEDREGSLWLGADAGLFQLRPRIVQAFTRKDGLPGDEVWSVSEAPNGTWQLATSSGWAIIPSADQGRQPPWETCVAHRCVLAAPDGALWMDAKDYEDDIHSGLLRVNPDGGLASFLPGEFVQALYLDHEKRLWVGTDRGAHCLRGGHPVELPGLPASEIRFCLQAGDGAMWFGSKGAGLFRWRDGGLERFTTSDGLADNYVVALHEDAEGILWIATANGLSRLAPALAPSVEKASAAVQSRFFTFTTAQGLLDNLINHILEDDAGFLWFSCNRGIFRIARAELNAVAEGLKSEVVCAVFGTADGMPSAETNGEHQPAGCKTRSGRLCFPTTMGLVAIDPEKMPKGELPPPVVIEEVKADGEVVFGNAVPGDSGLTDIRQSGAASASRHLPPGRARILEIRYAANSFVSPEKVRFKYKLEGHDKAWRDGESSERKVTYANLRPGAYTLRVKACNSHGVWNEAGDQFGLVLAPRFVETIWFPAGCAAGLLALSGGLMAWRLRWQRRAFKAERATALERERARIARDLHDDLGASLTGVALEMEALKRRGVADLDSLTTLASDTRALANTLRELAWTTNPRCDNAASLGTFLGEIAERFCQAAGLECKLELPVADDARGVPARVRHELLVVMKESLANSAKHSSARSVTVNLSLEDGAVCLVIRDAGRGFDPGRARAGNGLGNMRERVEQGGGTFTVTSSLGAGTAVTAWMPLDAGRRTGSE